MVPGQECPQLTRWAPSKHHAMEQRGYSSINVEMPGVVTPAPSSHLDVRTEQNGVVQAQTCRGREEDTLE